MNQRKPRAFVVTLRLDMLIIVLAFAVGFAIVFWALRDDPQNADTAATVAEAPSALVLPVAAQKLWFAPMEGYQGESLEDAEFDQLLATLQERMAADETLADFEREAPVYLHSFVRRVAMPELTPEQSAKTSAYLEQLADEHPGQRQMIGQQREMLEEYYAKANEGTLPFNLAAEGWFPGIGDLDPNGEPFTDNAVDQLVAILDAMLKMPETLADFEAEADIHFWRFGNRLQNGRLSDEQTARVVAFLDEVAEKHPGSAELIGRNRFQVEKLLPGREAPNIVGKDLDGVEFALNDYRDNIVLIYFSGQWCGPCRTEYPYKRFMLELYEDDPVVILGVNSDEDIETALQAKEDEGLDYRAWWDGHGEVSTEGPIATEWNVSAWPSIYILDENGVIRHAQKRHADVITSVNELLWDLQSRQRSEAAET